LPNVNPSLHATNAFELPVTPGVQMHDLLTVSLKAGTIDHVINGVGNAWSPGIAWGRATSSNTRPCPDGGCDAPPIAGGRGLIARPAGCRRLPFASDPGAP